MGGAHYWGFELGLISASAICAAAVATWEQLAHAIASSGALAGVAAALHRRQAVPVLPYLAQLAPLRLAWPGWPRT